MRSGQRGNHGVEKMLNMIAIESIHNMWGGEQCFEECFDTMAKSGVMQVMNLFVKAI